MNQREPSDAEVDAAFDDIVAHLRSREPEPVRDDPEPLGTEPEASDDQPATPPQTTGWRVVEFTSFPTDTTSAPSARTEAAGDEDDPVDTGWRTHIPIDPDEVTTPAETWAEVPREPLPPWRPAAATVGAFALVAAATVVMLLVVVGVILPWWATWGALVAVLAAAGLLLSRIPHHRDDSDDDGARV